MGSAGLIVMSYISPAIVLPSFMLVLWQALNQEVTALNESFFFLSFSSECLFTFGEQTIPDVYFVSSQIIILPEKPKNYISEMGTRVVALCV